MTLRFGFHDSIASAVVHGVSGAFTLGVLFNLGPRIGKYTKEGLARTVPAQQPAHHPAGADADLHRASTPSTAACLVIASTSFPGWANIYLSPTTLGSITMVITFGFAGGFTGGYFASRGDPFWTVSGGLAGVIGVSAGADVYAPTLAYLLAMADRRARRLRRQLDREEDARGRRGRRGRGPRRLGLPRASSGSASSRPATRPASTTSTRDLGPAARRGDVPAARLPDRLGRLVGAEEAEPPARAAGGRDRRARHGRVRAGHLPAGGRRRRREHDRWSPTGRT